MNATEFIAAVGRELNRMRAYDVLETRVDENRAQIAWHDDDRPWKTIRPICYDAVVTGLIGIQPIDDDDYNRDIIDEISNVIYNATKK